MAEPLFNGKTPKEEFDEFLSEVNNAVNEVARRYDLEVASGGAKYNTGSKRLTYTLKIERRTGMTPDEIVDRIVGEAEKCQPRGNRKK